MKPAAYVIHFFSIIALAAIMVSSCSLLTFSEITDIELDHSSKALSIGERFQLTADISPSYASEADIDWSSSAPETVSVSSDGMLQALSLGEAVITAVSSTDNQIEAESFVTVKASVNYDVNGAESGQPPEDSELYAIGDKVTVKDLPDDSERLKRKYYIFNGWNSSSDGSGTPYAAGDTLEVTENSGSINFYAQWIRLEDSGVSIAFTNPDNPDISFTGTYPEVNMWSSFTVTASLESAGYSWYLDGDMQTLDGTSSPMSEAGETLQTVSIDTTGLSIGTHTITVITDEDYSSSFSFTVISEDLVGQGTEDNPFQIRTLEDLRFLTQNHGYWDSYFVQTADIDAAATQYWDDSDDDCDGDAYNDAADAADAGDNEGDEGFLPIGNNTTPFTGSYDGGGYEISNLTIARPSADYVGLFGRAESAGFKNVNLSEVNITGMYQIGALIGEDPGGDLLIENCSAVSGTLEGTRFVGGIAGRVLFGGSISSSSSESNLTIRGMGHVGGIVGEMGYGAGELSGCSVSAEIEKAGDGKTLFIGGIVGGAGNKGSVTVDTCEFDGSIEISVPGFDVANIGGLVGLHYAGDVEDSSSSGSIQITADSLNSEVRYIGGLIGLAGRSNITDSQSDGNMKINTDGGVAYIGGLAGFLDYTAEESRSGGSISITGATSVQYAGGLLGELYSHGVSKRSLSETSLSISGVNAVLEIGGFAGRAGGLIQDCFSRSPVSVTAKSHAEVGGFIGYNKYGGTIERCYAAGPLDATATGDDSPTVSIGGFAESAGDNDIVGSFWSSDAVGDYDSVSSMSYDGITKSNDTAMKTESTYTAADWDFSDDGIWTMLGSISINDGYPIFQYMLPQ